MPELVPMPTTTALYAGLLGLMSLVIGALAGRLRARTGIFLGDGGNAEMTAAMRRHGNFVENVPMLLVLMGLLELNRVDPTYLHVMGVLIVVTRAAHAYGMRADEASGRLLRGIGAGGSGLVMLTASVMAIASF